MNAPNNKCKEKDDFNKTRLIHLENKYDLSLNSVWGGE
ncbi:hypothetical protein BACCIP111895_02500 [Neobacillus rhizosphaerae]|uniref:Uncharacterized protein n=1 Tax=Neobacillus rhizosphaerae TaxID=2880965 RepID=A0ABN8KP02_9BACI|nr:hypothetical protein BACCIP111895_02500 [Neobacillus rhizosphaerae]